MFLKLFLVLSVGVLYVAANCGPPQSHPIHYEEWGCKPSVQEPPCNSIAAYNCPDWNTLDKTKCHYNGKAYSPGEQAMHAPDADACSPHCTCQEAHGDEPADWACATPECPEHLGRRPPPNCISQYEPDKCCATGQVCDAEKEALHKCVRNDEVYYKNTRIYSKYEPCYTCLCDERFNNNTKLEYNKETCKKISCQLELRYSSEARKGCAPVYYSDNVCCPVAWQCPSSDDKVQPSQTTLDPKLACKFGALTLKRYDRLETNDKCITCLCNQGPVLTCTKQANC